MDQPTVAHDNAANAFNSKRLRDEPASESPESKLARVDSANSIANSPDLEQNLAGSDTGRSQVDSDSSQPNPPEAKRIQYDLLNILDDSEEPAIQGLDSLIRSFEEEILVPAPVSEAEATSLHGGSQPDLGYLLEASDDELGLPPTFSSGEEDKLVGVDLSAGEVSGSGAGGFSEMIGFEDGIPNYDSFEFGLAGDSVVNGENYGYNEGGDFVALGGLFDYSDENCVAGLQWQPESLSAL